MSSPVRGRDHTGTGRESAPVLMGGRGEGGLQSGVPRPRGPSRARSLCSASPRPPGVEVGKLFSACSTGNTSIIAAQPHPGSADPVAGQRVTLTACTSAGGRAVIVLRSAPVSGPGSARSSRASSARPRRVAGLAVDLLLDDRAGRLLGHLADDLEVVAAAELVGPALEAVEQGVDELAGRASTWNVCGSTSRASMP